jgi:hypothetical protein
LNLFARLTKEEQVNIKDPKRIGERVDIVPCDDGWPGYEERVAEF